MLATLALLACREPLKEGPAPWASLEPRPLDAFAPVLTTRFNLADDAEAPARLLPIPLLPSVAGLDTGAGVLLAMDARYRHSGAGVCVPLFEVELPADGTDRVGRCGADEFLLQRGSLGGGTPWRAAAADPARSRLVALDARGRWWTANVDLDSGDPVDWLRPIQAGSDAAFAEAEGTDASAGLLAISAEGRLAAAFGDTLWTWDALDEPGTPTPTDPVRDLAFLGEQLFVATDDALYVDGELLDVGAPGRLAPDGDRVWVTLPDTGRLVAADAVHVSVEEIEVPGLTGPLSVAPDGRVWLAVSDGVAVVADGAEVARHAVDAPLDVVAQPSGEIVLLGADGAVDVRFDETTLPGADPLHVAVAAFFENPRKQTESLSCRGEPPNMRGYLDSARTNREWLDDVPAAVMFGITPGVARRAVRCEMGEELLALAEGDRIEAGVLFHEAPACEAGDQACVDDHVRLELAALLDVPLAATWTSGASAWDLDGADWIGAVLDAGAPARHLFFGQAARADLTNDDLRAKEAWPWSGTTPPTGWVERGDGGSIPSWPGMPISAFLLGSCENLLSVECGRVDAGGAATFDATDLEVLSLLIRRAAFLRSDSGPDTWSFHLPALELYDYTADCTRDDDGIWTGETCQAALLQAWLFDVHARLVEADIVAWTLPSELPTP